MNQEVFKLVKLVDGSSVEMFVIRTESGRVLAREATDQDRALYTGNYMEFSQSAQHDDTPYVLTQGDEFGTFWIDAEEQLDDAA